MFKLPKNAKPARNEDLVLKRFSDPEKWGWGKLGELYSIHRQYAKDVFERDKGKYLTKSQLRQYGLKLLRLKVGL